MVGTHDVVLLDIDGVLCESQEPIIPEMRRSLESLAMHKIVYFVTGNPYVKSVDLLNGSIAMFSGVFCNSGDELRSMRGKFIWGDTETPCLPERIESTLRTVFPTTARNCIEWRNPRCLNFSKIGRFASMDERKSHDASWREGAKNYITRFYPDVEVAIGGSISIDIYSKGADKARAAKWVNDNGGSFIFIGDKTQEGGNDYPVKVYCDEHSENICLQSKGVVHTIELIDEILER